MRRKKKYNEPHTIYDLVDDLREYYGYNFTEQQGCYIVKKILNIVPKIKGYCYKWDDFFKARENKDADIKRYIAKLEWDNEPIEKQQSDDSNMVKVSRKLLDRDIYDFKYEVKKPTIVMTESLFKRLFEEKNIK